MTKEKLIVLYGGRSAEREVSVMSATNVVQSVDYEKFVVQTVFISKEGDFFKGVVFESTPDEPQLTDNHSLSADKLQQIAPSALTELGDVVLPMLHGPQGEDGSIQGFLEVLKMPYAGPSVLAAAVTMDKLVSKEIFAQQHLPQVPYVGITDGQITARVIDKINKTLIYPLFVKPANMGSSVGISKVRDRAHLKEALELAVKYDSRVIIEEGIVDPHEVECGALGNGDKVEISLPGEVANSGVFYTYDEKYTNDALTIDVPAKLPPEIIEQIRVYAKKAYQAVGGTGLARCDFFVSQDGDIFLNELNAIPGFTAFSMYPMVWENMGVSVTEQITRFVELGKEKFIEREKHLAY